MSDTREARSELHKCLDAVTCELIHGLTTDGGHHKQYSLEQVLRMIAGDEFTDKAHGEFQWERGQPS